MANTGKHIFRGIIEVPTAKNDKEAVNLKQVKELISKFHLEPVRLCLSEELTGTYSDNVLTLNTSIGTIDGVETQLNDTVLLTNLIDKKMNGIYTITTKGNPEVPSVANITVTTSTTLTSASVDKDVFEGALTPTTGDYQFTYDGTTENSWLYNSNPIALNTYGISVEGTPSDGDILTVNYTEKVALVGATLTRREDLQDGCYLNSSCRVNILEGTDYAEATFISINDSPIKINEANVVFIREIGVDDNQIKVSKHTITGNDTDKTFIVNHDMDLENEYSYMLFAKDVSTGDEIYINNYPNSLNSTNSITIEFDEAPKTGETFKLFILGL